MLLDDTDTEILKKWVVKKLEDISDADSDVLADYVLALIKSDESEDQIRTTCIENLTDFLDDNSANFVEQVLTAIRLGSYKPTYVAPRPQAPAFTPRQPSATQIGPIPPRKRGRDPMDTGDDETLHLGQRGGRGNKQMRRGGEMGRGRGRGGMQTQPYQQISQPPQMPPGFPTFDPNNPMAAIMAMQAMGFPTMPGFPQMSGQQTSIPPGNGIRCRDYDTQGFCAKGSECPFEHGEDTIVMPGRNEEYDPKTASIRGEMPEVQTQSIGFGRTRGNHPLRARGRGRGNYNERGRGGNRATFSSAAPNHDRSVTSIVVEQIPEENFTEDAVRGHFSNFGEVTEIDMQPYKRLAVVKFSDYDTAARAKDDPAVIFNNRFVKTYWYKPDAFKSQQENGKTHDSPAPARQEDQEMADPEEIARRTAEAQRQHEEKQRKLKEASAAKSALDERIKASAEERRQLMERLASKTGISQSPAPRVDDGTPGPQTKSSSQTEALKAKLKELEEEAMSLGIPTEENAPYQPYYQGYQPRGVPRGRYRGYRARGVAAARGRGGFGPSVAKLDNRPKGIAVKANVNFDDEKVSESLRSFLFSVGDYASLSNTSSNTAVVSFRDRWVGEKFLMNASADNNKNATAGEIPGIGAVEFSWVAAVEPAVASNGAGSNGNHVKDEGGDVNMDTSTDATGNVSAAHVSAPERDYDVASDDETWR